MAWLQANRSGNYHINFRFGGRKFKRSLRTKSAAAAEGRRLRLEENIRLVESGRLVIPAEADVPTFLLSDGKLNNKVVVTTPLTLTSLFQAYFEAVSTGHLEDTTIACQQIHRRHLEKHFGRGLAVQKISPDDLQGYVTSRAKDKGRRGRKVDGNTIRKEIATFRAIWNWGIDAGKLKGDRFIRGHKKLLLSPLWNLFRRNQQAKKRSLRTRRTRQTTSDGLLASPSASTNPVLARISHRPERGRKALPEQRKRSFSCRHSVRENGRNVATEVPAASAFAGCGLQIW